MAPPYNSGKRGWGMDFSFLSPEQGEDIWHLDLYYGSLSSGILDLVSEFSSLVWKQLELKKKHF